MSDIKSIDKLDEIYYELCENPDGGGGSEFVEFYRSDPVAAAYDLLNIDLAPIQRILLKNMWFKNYVIMVCSRGLGKSQSIDSMSFIDHEGLFYLYEKFDKIPEFIKDGDTIEQLCASSIYTADGYKPTKRISLEKNIQGLHITTRYGFENKGSNHHKILTIDNIGNFCYKRLDEFEVGDYVCVQRGQNTFGDVVISQDDAYLLGLFIGDGCISSKYSHADITTSDSEIVNFCVNYCNKHKVSYRVDFDKRTKDTMNIIFKKFDYFFDKYNVCRSLSYFKCVPKSIRCANKESQIQFLRGYFDTDGSALVKDGNISCCSVSLELVKEIQMMLLNFGIISKIRTKKTRSKFGKAYLLDMFSINSYKFINEIGFSLTRKQSNAESYLNNIKFNVNNDIIPYIKNGVCNDVAVSLNKSNDGFSGKLKTIVHGDYYNFTYDRLRNFLDEVNLLMSKEYNIDNKTIENIKKLTTIIDSNYYFDTVKSIESWCGDCYDFEMDMDGDPNYFSNGFINHNTFLLGINAVLHCLLFPGYRVGLISSSFRQSKLIFSEVEKLYQRSNILRDACEKRPVRGADTCYLKFKNTEFTNGSFIEALPLGVDGGKIRGSRFYLIEIDEAAQVPNSVIDMVIRPMAAVVLEPMQRVRELEKIKKSMEKTGHTIDEYQDFQKSNKMVIASSGYFKFNHLWSRMKSYWKAMDDPQEGSKYSVFQVPYTLLPEGFLDANNVKEALRTMSSFEFNMEYEAHMVSDSDGFFKASLLEKCTIGSDFSIKNFGDKDKEYVLGIDPNQGGSAACGIVIIEIGDPLRMVYVDGLKKKTTQQMVIEIQRLTDAFNIKRIFMDSQGGGKPIKDLLQEGYDNHIPIIDLDDETMIEKTGKRILQLINPTPMWISDANFDTLALFENAKLRFPAQPVNSNPIVEELYEKVELLKSQILNIVVTPTSRGMTHFDTPKKGQNKDLYSALILAAWGSRELVREGNETQKILYSQGLTRPHKPGAVFKSVSVGVGKSYTQHAVLKKAIN